MAIFQLGVLVSMDLRYTSRLTFFGDTKLNGTVIKCTLSKVVLVKNSYLQNEMLIS